MASFRLFPALYQFTDDAGAILAGGSVQFFTSETTTPADVYGDPDLGTNNGDTLIIGTDGRLQVDCWGDADLAYRVLVLDANDNPVGSGPVDFVQSPASAAVSVPDPADGNDGDVITTDGVTYSLETPSYVPDPTGHAGEYLTTDGTVNSWSALDLPDTAILPDGGVTVTTTTGTTVLIIGTLVQMWGSGTISASGAISASEAIVFADEGGIVMDTCEGVWPVPTNVLGIAFGLTLTLTAKSGTGFTVVATTQNVNDVTIDGNVGFDWYAKGTKALDP